MPQLPIQTNGDNHEPMELDIPDYEIREDSPQVEDINIDLENYISHYHGLARIHRLEFIADHCRSLKVEALNLAIEYIKQNTFNVRDYARLFKKLQDALEERHRVPCNISLDLNWIDTKTKQAGLRLSRLENDLKNFRSNSMKENIRRGQDDLGDHFLDCGELENAYNAYARSREYVLTHRNQLNQCLNMIRVSLLIKNWYAVSNHVIKAESQPTNDSPTNPTVSTKLHCAAGLYELNSRHYKKAAKHFLSTNFDHFNHKSTNLTSPGSSAQANGSRLYSPGPSSSNNQAGPSSANSSGFVNSFSSPQNERDVGHKNSTGQWDLLAPINIAVYGSLCALASYSRQELANNIINSSSFKQFSELEPQMRDAVNRFYESKYAACLSILQEIKNTLLLDMYLAPHVERLYRLIRNKALIQYFEPYNAASMSTMAEAFKTSVAELEKEIVILIYDGHIRASIDSHHKVLYSKHTDLRTLTYERAFNLGKLWQRRTRAMISRSVVLNAGLMIGFN